MKITRFKEYIDGEKIVDYLQIRCSAVNKTGYSIVAETYFEINTEEVEPLIKALQEKLAEDKQNGVGIGQFLAKEGTVVVNDEKYFNGEKVDKPTQDK